MKKFKKIATMVLVGALLTSNSASAWSTSGWYDANGSGYKYATSTKVTYWDGVYVDVDQIAKDGKRTDKSKYKKVKVRVEATNNKAYWTNDDVNTTKKTSNFVVAKNRTARFILTDSAGNAKNTKAAIWFYFSGNNPAVDADVHSTLTAY